MPHRPLRFLLLSASMGAGHDAVAGELARRLRARGHEVVLRDVLTLLPAGAGRALRAGYRGTVRHLPRLYDAVYAGFLAPGAGPRPSSAPLAALAERPLLRAVDRWRPDAVVATFHLAAQVTGRLRASGALAVPAAVVVVDFAVHRGWLHAGNDLHVCVTERAAADVRTATGRTAEATGPVVPARFFRAGDAAGTGAGTGGEWRALLRRYGRPEHGGLGADAADGADAGTAVLLSAGAWGVGHELTATAGRLARHGWLPVLLCGRDERLRRHAAAVPRLLALGWVADMPGLMAAARVLVDNAAGQTAAQALAAGLPVVAHRPLPGHGAEGVRQMAAAGLSQWVSGPGQPAAAVARLARPGPERERQVAAGRAVFRRDPAQRLEELAVAGRAASSTGLR